MTKRIKIDSSTFKILQKTANVDVENATADQLAFDGFGSPIAGVILKGATRTDDGTWATDSSNALVPTGSGWSFDPFQTTRKYRNISFPSQVAEPDVLFMVRPLNDTSYATPHYSHINEYGSSGPSARLNDGTSYYYVPDSWAGTACWASATTNTLTLRVDYINFSSGNTAWEFSYMVFQPFRRLVNGAWQNLPGLYE